MKTISNITVQCDRCGKTIVFNPEKENLLRRKYWEINLGEAEYGSQLDGCTVKFDICDNCLVNILNQFDNKGVQENE